MSKVRRRGAETDELDVHVPAREVHVPEEATVAIELVEPRIGLEGYPRADLDESGERSGGGRCVALPSSHLGSVDLDEPDPRASGQHEGVAVGDALDHHAVDGRGSLGLGARGTQHEQKGSSGHA